MNSPRAAGLRSIPTGVGTAEVYTRSLYINGPSPPRGDNDSDGDKDLAGVGLKEVAAAVTPRLMEHRKRFARMTKGIDTLLK